MTGNAPSQTPVLSLGRSPVLAVGELAAASSAILVSAAIIVRFWYVLPSSIPIHFGFSRQPDAWGDRVMI